jgi:hypothetical protein
VYTTQNNSKRESGETGREIPFRAAEEACSVTAIQSHCEGGNKERLASATRVSNYRYC